MLKIIGSIEWCELKELRIPPLRARVDTGAKTSSIQATNISTFQKEEASWVRFDVTYIENGNQVSVVCEAPVVAVRKVKTSNEVAEKRIIIRTPLTIGDQTYSIELTLANRDTLEYKMLLGREALNDRFLVDPGKTFLL